MGNLHSGHLALVQQARNTCDLVIATIFVNPLQFGPSEDFDRYPRTLDQDKKLLHKEGCQLLFAPGVDEIYPEGRKVQSTVSVPILSDVLCGANRPGHFDGVTTVVSKLLNLTQPDTLFLGEKDWQQLTIIRKMIHDLNIAVTVESVATVRDADGLAMSSRNNLLTKTARQRAPLLFQVLSDMNAKVRSGDSDYAAIELVAMTRLREAGFEPDYITIRDETTLGEPLQNCHRRRAFGAARLDSTRLIDNVAIDS